MAKVGRPRALCDTKRCEVCALVSAGCGMDEAAHFVGCSVRTIRREALRNEEFHEALRRAELSSQLDPIRTLRKAASTHWRAAAWLLERTNPSRFARQPADLITPDHFEKVVTELFELLLEEIPDPETQQRIYLRMLTLENQFKQKAFAVTHPRRDPHRAKKLLSA